jgi:hypothetical protein
MGIVGHSEVGNWSKLTIILARKRYDRRMRVTEKQALLVRCPTCGAKAGERCELSAGLPRTEPHRDRRPAASDKYPPSSVTE